VVLFTNFESLSGMKRQLTFLRKIASQHLLVTVFFENTELDRVLAKPAENIEAVYTKAIAEQFAFEKRQIVKELNTHGIMSILTAPKNLTVNTLNKYLEIKARNLI
jgi:predicted transcriptional regulator YheO